MQYIKLNHKMIIYTSQYRSTGSYGLLSYNKKGNWSKRKADRFTVQRFIWPFISDSVVLFISTALFFVLLLMPSHFFLYFF